jgi:hypothetical protein
MILSCYSYIVTIIVIDLNIINIHIIHSQFKFLSFLAFSPDVEPAVYFEEILRRFHEMQASVQVQVSDDGSPVGESSYIPAPESIQVFQLS